MDMRHREAAVERETSSLPGEWLEHRLAAGARMCIVGSLAEKRELTEALECTRDEWEPDAAEAAGCEYCCNKTSTEECAGAVGGCCKQRTRGE